MTYRIYITPDCSEWATVSRGDYVWALSWCWQFTWDKHKRKKYATRSTSLPGGKRIKIYLHKAVMARADKIPPTPAHTIGDHQDGDSLNCTRENLEYATPSVNRRTARRVQPAPVSVQAIEDAAPWS